jgi:hypothetical protein
MATKKVTVTVPFNVTLATDDHVYREGDTFEAERADVEKWIAAGNLVEVVKKKA